MNVTLKHIFINKLNLSKLNLIELKGGIKK
jgi:hypothetical protein